MSLSLFLFLFLSLSFPVKEIPPLTFCWAQIAGGGRMSRKWTQPVWDALNALAEKNCPPNTYNRESLLGYRRAKLVDQHAHRIDELLAATPDATSEQILAALTPAPARAPEIPTRRDWDKPWPGPLPPVDPQAGDKLRAIIAEQRRLHDEGAQVPAASQATP